jgi:hypothetical protein
MTVSRHGWVWTRFVFEPSFLRFLAIFTADADATTRGFLAIFTADADATTRGFLAIFAADADATPRRVYRVILLFYVNE